MESLVALVLLGATGFPQPIDNHLNDFAGVVDASDALAIRDLCAATLRETGTSIVVVTIQSLAEIEDGRWPAFDEFKLALFNRWRIGYEDDNRGLMLMLTIQEHDLGIQPGAGWGTQYDGEFGSMCDRMIPLLRDGRHSAALLQGARDLDQFARRMSGASPAPYDPAPTYVPSTSSRPSSWIGTLVCIGAPILILLLFLGARRGGGGYGQGCGGGGWGGRVGWGLGGLGAGYMLGRMGGHRPSGGGGFFGGGGGGGGFRSSGRSSSFGGGFSRGGGASRKW